MTFPVKVAPFQYIIYRQKDTFGEWSKRNLSSLFLPYRDPNYSLTDIIHLMMSRLHQSHDRLMQMEQTERDAYFTKELELMKKEAEANKQNGQK